MKILVIGATSAIAQSVIRLYAVEKAEIYLIARDAEKLSTVCANAEVLGASRVHSCCGDLNNLAFQIKALDDAQVQLQRFDLALIAHGTLPNQQDCSQSVDATLAAIETNFTSTAALLTELANRFVTWQAGTIAVISSVAGDRGRQSNYVYGAAKGALSIFVQGLRNRLYRNNVDVLTIKPGFVDTPMTADFKKGLLWASADQVGLGIKKAVTRRRSVAYLPGFWFFIMSIIRLIPEILFKRMSL
ncbi:SDR family oxidoreductase [Agarivorans sp. QJM3NY_29]|uniref:SDR family oxidoreductase n=1 Tax=unclassified Agarivorans TaxID=2636026 RepID=UPI003D7CED60